VGCHVHFGAKDVVCLYRVYRGTVVFVGKRVETGVELWALVSTGSWHVSWGR
jgi:hypothetical protein